MSDYTATIKGTWDPGGIPPFSDPLAYTLAQQQARTATRTALGLGDGRIGFHIVGVDGISDRVWREHWNIEAYAGGPTLRFGGTDQPHASQVSLTLRVQPLSEVQQITGEPDRSMPYGGVLTTVVAALLLRARFGEDARQITINEGTGTFTPELLRFSDIYGTTIEVPYDTQGLAGYGFTGPDSDSQYPRMWLVSDDGSWKVSYLTALPAQSYTERWDPQDEPVPAFEPLPAPEPVGGA
jgi:hypothetical protein